MTNIDANMANALLAALQRQRENALNKLARAEANNDMLTAKVTLLQNQMNVQAEGMEEAPAASEPEA